VKRAIVITLFLLLCGTAQAGHKHKVSPAEAWARTPFANCVRLRESQNGVTAQNLYEIEGPHASGNYGDYEWLNGVSRVQQDLIAYQMFLRSGDSPWRPYDHCYWEMH
jgi:hypothetical protein